MQKSAPCGGDKERQREGECQAKNNSNRMWDPVLHGSTSKMEGQERSRFSRRGNLREIKDTRFPQARRGRELAGPKMRLLCHM
jgi:ribosomal protein L4